MLLSPARRSQARDARKPAAFQGSGDEPFYNQAQILQSEKMDSLGQLAATVALEKGVAIDNN